ncbi:hypothetical protein EXU48_05895 [Occultella glacieicola]|uniref:Aminoglycoside phosphotransferase domain-containing protein n=1 Tax=Occultella glacieicola TaxID=2518684 RepID=A0ABY2E5Q9_9MICO|nr:phosphotransferase [Occultella glacieicola]TDE95794.1 hypothetical protein EXU48_05895 [Occultella glacieicola]
MMRLGEIAAMRATVDEAWRSEIADRVGGRWALDPGSLRWWRSSASHVFVLPDGVDERGVLYVRFAPASDPAGARLAQGAALQERLRERSAAVAGPVVSRAGRVVERVPTAAGEMVAAAVLRVEGEEYDVDDLDEARAFAWGTALAGFHRAAGPAGAAGAAQSPRHDADLEALGADPDPRVAAAARTVRTASRALATGPTVVGHGDFELDNLRWRSERVVCFDLDESGPMPAVADVAAATRDVFDDWASNPGAPGLLRSFLSGYEDASGVAVDHRALIVHRAAVAAGSAAAVARAVGEPGPPPEDLAELADRLREHEARERQVLVTAAALLG